MVNRVVKHKVEPADTSDMADTMTTPGQTLSAGSLAEHLRILSRPDWVEAVVMFLKQQALDAGVCDAAQADRLVVSMTEAITNAIVHGSFGLDSALKEEPGAFHKAIEARKSDPDYTSRVVDIRVRRHDDRCVWTVTDEGDGFDVEKALARLESDDPMELLASGRGMTIMKAFVDEVAWSKGGRQIQLSVYLDKAVDRRGADRQRYTEAVGVVTDGGPCFDAIGRDISSTGVAFVSTTALAPGTRVRLTLSMGDEPARATRGTVVRCNAIAPPYHDLGVHFDAALDPAPGCG